MARTQGAAELILLAAWRNLAPTPDPAPRARCDSLYTLAMRRSLHD